MYFFAILTALISVSSYNYCVAENPETRFCVNCKFRVIPHPIYDSLNIEYAKCKLFPKKKVLDENTNVNVNTNYLVTGQNYKSNMEYHYCSTARMSDNMCGEEGAYYKPSPLKILFGKKCL